MTDKEELMERIKVFQEDRWKIWAGKYPRIDVNGKRLFIITQDELKQLSDD
jgi:hypothetical protein